MEEKARAAGVQVWTGRRVKKILTETILVDDEEVGYEFLVGADGAHSLVRRYMGIPFGFRGTVIQTRLKGTSDTVDLIFDFKEQGLWPAYAIPVQDQIILGIGNDPERMPVPLLKKRLAVLATSLGHKGPFRIEGGLIGITYHGIKFGNFYLVGDAAGLAHEFTGMGIYPAWLSGKEVARNILDPNYKFEQLKIVTRHKRFRRLMINLAYLFPSIPAYMMEPFIILMRSPIFRHTLFSILSPALSPRRP